MDPDNPPPGYHTESRARSGLVIGGGIMLGVAWAISAAAAGGALADNNNELTPLFVPVVGPFLTLGSADSFGSASDGLEQTGKVFGAIGLILDGVVQVAGFSMVVIGLSVRKDVVVKDEARLVPDLSIGGRGVRARWQF